MVSERQGFTKSPRILHNVLGLKKRKWNAEIWVSQWTNCMTQENKIYWRFYHCSYVHGWLTSWAISVSKGQLRWWRGQLSKSKRKWSGLWSKRFDLSSQVDTDHLLLWHLKPQKGIASVWPIKDVSFCQTRK